MTSAVSSAAFSPDGARVVTGLAGQDGAALGRGDGQADRGPQGPCGCGHGRRLLAGRHARRDRLRGQDGAALGRGDGQGDRHVFSGHADAVIGVAFSPDGTRVVTGSRGQDGAALGRGDGQAARHRSRAIRVRSGRRLLAGRRTRRDRLARTRRRGCGTRRRASRSPTLEGHRVAVLAVAFSPGRRSVLTGVGRQDGAAVGRGDGQAARHPRRPHGSVIAVAFSPDGASVLTGYRDNTARLWDVATGKPVATLEGHTRWVTAVAFSPDGAASDRLLGQDGAAVGHGHRQGGCHTRRNHGAHLGCRLLARYGARVVTGSINNTARLWDVATGEVIATLEGHTGPVTAVAFLPRRRARLDWLRRQDGSPLAAVFVRPSIG